jgi:formylglycine-generating enzyme required for sulfatase activity
LPADANLGFVHIDADPGFCIGTRSADRDRVAKAIGAKVGDNEINDAPTPTHEFHIARFPVTVSQFQAFVGATGFKVGDEGSLRDPGSRPVRRVSRREAIAYCHWLNNVFATSPLFADSHIGRLIRNHGWRVALPSELEWEKAARGGREGAAYPWGDTSDPQRANYDDAGINDTSVVGCFPANHYDLHDMIGNVWEWTRSAWDVCPYSLDDPVRENLNAEDDKHRVLRGGARNDSRDYARCAHRVSSPPEVHFESLGFGVVLRSSPV